jgi:hypothetical protein
MNGVSEDDLVIALLHRERFANMIAEQEARIDRIGQTGGNVENSKRLLELLQTSLRILDEFIDRQLAK